MASPPRNTAPVVDAYRLMNAGRFDEALIAAQKAVAGARTCVPAHGMLATILLRLGRPADAESVVASALQFEQGGADAFDALAHVSMLLGRHERSNSLYHRVVEVEPKEARFWYNLASSERSFGRLLEAEAACNRAISLRETEYGAYLLRSELRVQTETENHVEELQHLLQHPDASDRTRIVLGYALAKELDDLRRYDEAFHWFALAAATRRRHLAYEVATDEAKLARIADVFPGKPGPETRPPADDDSGRHIFIVGLPRSGTTLLEHMLTGLAEVRSNGETDNFSRALITASTPTGPDVFARASLADPHVVGAIYRRLAGGETGDERLIEKMPLNYLYLGAIRRALPAARLLRVRREPIDSCFAMYRTLFGAAYPFSYDFEDLARYHAAYDRLMTHWQRSLGDSLLTVSYEELVSDPARVGAQVARHCGLEWSARALETHKSASVSFTASAAQIRRPIYGSSSGRWRHYRRHLLPLMDALRRSGVSLPEDA